jgi:hypothetical protein
MKRGLILGLALLFVFAFTGCPDPDPDPTPGPNPNPNPNPGTKAYEITFNLNWPSGTAPAGPAKATTNATTGQLTSAQITAAAPTAAMTPTDKEFGGWFLTKAQADATAATGRVTNSTTFTAAQSVFARWGDKQVGPILDLTGVVEKVTMKNAWGAVYQFVIPANKTWGDYDNLTAKFAADAANLEKSIRAIRIHGNYLAPSDFDFYDRAADVGGKKALAQFDDKNAAYIMHQGIERVTVAAALASFNETSAESILPNTWYTVNYPNFWLDKDAGGVAPNGSYVPGNKTEAYTGTLYLALGLSTEGTGNGEITAFYKDVKLVGKSGTTDIVGIPAYFTYTKEGTTYTAHPAFAGYQAANNGYEEGSREYVGTGTAPGAITLQDSTDNKTVTFNMNWPTDATNTAPATNPTAQTDGVGKLSDAQLAAPATNPVKAGGAYRFLRWYTTSTGTGGSNITKDTVFDADDEIFAIWEFRTTPAAPIVDNDPPVNVTGSNQKFTDDDSVEWALMIKTSNDSLVNYAFTPANMTGIDFTKVKVTLAVSKEHDDFEDGDIQVILKNGNNSWGDANGTTNAQRELDFAQPGGGTDDTWTLEFTWPLTYFNGSGFALQYNSYTANPAKNWLLRITKVEILGD